MVDYIENNVVYNLENIWDYVENIEFWDNDDHKFDFWYRFHKHNRIFYKVMELNGIKFNNDENIKDCTEELIQEMKERNKNYNIELIWED